MSAIDEKSTVLVVDDTPANIALLVNILKTEYRTKVATSGEKALAVAGGAEPPDLILLDVMMPEMDGFTVCAKLKENPATRHVPVIFVTGASDQDDEEKGLALGAVDYIIKPVSPTLVKARVAAHLELARYRAQTRHAVPCPNCGHGA